MTPHLFLHVFSVLPDMLCGTMRYCTKGARLQIWTLVGRKKKVVYSSKVQILEKAPNIQLEIQGTCGFTFQAESGIRYLPGPARFISSLQQCVCVLLYFTLFTTLVRRPTNPPKYADCKAPPPPTHQHTHSDTGCCHPPGYLQHADVATPAVGSQQIASLHHPRRHRLAIHSGISARRRYSKSDL